MDGPVSPDSYCPGQWEIFSLRETRLQTGCNGLIGARDEKISRLFKQPRGDPGHLFGSLALPENDFRKAVPKSPMVIQLGIAQVLKGQMPHAVQRRADFNFSGSHSLKQSAQLLLVHLFEPSRCR